MIFGMSILTFVHVLLSLIGIFSGFIVIFGLLASKRLDGLTALFLTTTVATSITGYFFPIHKLLPSHIVGAISLVALAIAIFARYLRQLAGPWRRTYVICAIISQYLNVFVLIAQLFLKVPALHALAPNGSEPPFVATQVACMLLFVVLGIFASIKFRLEPAHAA